MSPGGLGSPCLPPPRQRRLILVHLETLCTCRRPRSHRHHPASLTRIDQGPEAAQQARQPQQCYDSGSVRRRPLRRAWQHHCSLITHGINAPHTLLLPPRWPPLVLPAAAAATRRRAWWQPKPRPLPRLQQRGAAPSSCLAALQPWWIKRPRRCRQRWMQAGRGRW